MSTIQNQAAPAAAGLPLSPTERTRHRRMRALGQTDRESLYAVLRDGMIAHLGVITDGWPMVVPTVYGFDADTLYLHGSVASQSMNPAEQTGPPARRARPRPRQCLHQGPGPVTGHGEPYSPGPVTSTSSRNDRAASYAVSINIPVCRKSSGEIERGSGPRR